MATRNIIQVPDPLLYKVCRKVETFDQKLWTLLDDMKETLEAADGAGLAAPQVAVLKRVAVVSTSDGYFELINPVVKRTSGEQTGIEGCLSVKGKYGEVTRPKDVSVVGQDRFGKTVRFKVSGFTARAFLHEIDHLDGIIYTTKCKEVHDEEE